jgi:hypothetical protein
MRRGQSAMAAPLLRNHLKGGVTVRVRTGLLCLAASSLTEVPAVSGC